jgi:hypothetical protein
MVCVFASFPDAKELIAGREVICFASVHDAKAYAIDGVTRGIDSMPIAFASLTHARENRMASDRRPERHPNWKRTE